MIFSVLMGLQINILLANFGNTRFCGKVTYLRDIGGFMEEIKMQLQGGMLDMVHRAHLEKGRFHLPTHAALDEAFALNSSVQGVCIEL